MPQETNVHRATPAKDAPFWYRITVRGQVPQSWIDRLGEMHVTATSRGRSTLEGPIADSSDLAGVLDTLCQLGLPILKVATLTKGNVDR